MRLKRLWKILLTFPLFLFISLIPWLLVLYASLLVRQFRDSGRTHLAMACLVVAIAIGALTAIATLWCFVVWLVVLVRRMSGLETEQDA